MTEQFANNASSTLNGAINNVTTTIVVTSSATFPSVGNFRLLIGVNPLTAEIVLVTNVSGNTLTVVRGQEGTTAISWADLTTVTHILTAGAVNQLKMDVLSNAAGKTVQTGYNYANYFYVPIYSVLTSTNSSVFVNAGAFEFDPTSITSASGTRTITLRVIAETTSPLMTIQLFNFTTATVVTGSTLTTSSSVPVLLTTSDLTSNLSAGLATYQVQIKMDSGTPTDRVLLSMASFKVIWS
jgi:hypothetical protein